MVGYILGNYLQDTGKITKEQLKEIIENAGKVRVKLGLIAVAEGYMTAAEAEEVNRLQAVMDKRFGDIAVENGYLTDEQVGIILKKQGDEYMVFLQTLVDMNIMGMADAEKILSDFCQAKGLTDAQCEDIKSGDIDRILPVYLPASGEQYKEIISYARQQIPDVGFSSDIIVGFPGETYEEYLETENLVKENGFTQLFTFIYSKRKGTKAAELEDNTPHSEKTERLNRLIKIQQDIFFKYLESFNNKTVRALVEETKPGGYSARLANTLVVHFKTDRTDLLDNYVNVRITGKKGTVLTGEII